MPLLLLHGWGCTHSIFDAFLPEFSSHHKVFALDFPGFGESDEPSEVWGVEEYTRMVEAFCASLNIEKPAIVCHSFGGRVAILFASRNSVDRMIFADAAGIRPRRSLSYYIKVYSYKAAKWWILKVRKDEKAFLKLRASRGSSDYKNASERMKAILSKTVSQDLSAYLPKIKAPVLLFWGENDTATPLSDGETMERLMPNAALVKVPSAGHFSYLDQWPLVSRVLASYLGSKEG